MARRPHAHSRPAAPCSGCGRKLARRPNETGLCGDCWRARPLFLRTMPDRLKVGEAVAVVRRLAQQPDDVLLEALEALPLERLPAEYRRRLAAAP